METNQENFNEEFQKEIRALKEVKDNQELKDLRELDSLKNKLTKQLDEEEANKSPEAIHDEYDSMFKIADSKKFPSFKQLVVLHKEKVILQEIINYVKNKKKYEGIGKVEAPEGILFYGLPGTGKTILARSFAKETNLPMFELQSSMFSRSLRGEAELFRFKYSIFC
ncbi:AAA family ATPase ['Camptotheca acuminata' phytoplasma]|uniref:AAA family ATPase n=1 Tax='Camptotheca acuminata' phytoplasma TaxID=3239192 RepID=UPI00351A3135